ncbi:MAG: bifunctional glutamate N-acetyltransferase/amino-acid acetyltransferase ArgJ [Sulfurovaceae bacterium]|nr:bifunctional glutamate N-acetyltransferase/amino-acid acetyltransferase ArgJ [Sulfurovaceae bacterium]
MFQILSLKNGLDNVKGFYSGSTNVGLRKANSDGSIDGDVSFIRSDSLCDIAARFTTNRFTAAPIKHFLKYPANFQTDFILINAKNANAMTGKKGIDDIEELFEILGSKLKITNPIMSSTGVIGYRLPLPKIASAFDDFDFSSKDSNKTARAIMTTDSFKKEICFKVELKDGSHFHLAAIAKGAGMINPAMATMLCFIITDANIPKDDMDELLGIATENSFNRISVDGDTSTNDSVFLLSNRQSGAYNKDAFGEALKKITFELAMMILRDGEGATKTVAFEVKGALTDEDAKKASMLLSNSLLVKTALFGEDPNWGRIASTIGASGIECDEEKLVIHYDELLIYSRRESDIIDEDWEEKAYKIMKQPSFHITCDLGLGNGHFTSYGCDLSYDYVKINAEYRT